MVMMSNVMGADDVVQRVRVEERLETSRCGLDTNTQRLCLISAIVGKFNYFLTILRMKSS